MADLTKFWAWLSMPDHVQQKVVRSEVSFHWWLSPRKNHLLTDTDPSKDIDDQRIAESDWTKAYYSL